MAASRDYNSMDHWILGEEGVLVCRHNVPRETLYIPSSSEVDMTATLLMSTRVTYIKYLDGTTELINDHWTGLDAERALTKSWTGQTIFFVDRPNVNSNHKCATVQCLPSMPHGKWLMDTGCAYDLISQKLVGDGPTRHLEI